MDMSHRTVNGIEILELSGRFDAYEVPIVTAWFDEHPQVNHVVVNLAGVAFIDSSGLAALVKGLKHCRQNGGELAVSNLQQAVVIIFELTRLDKAIRIFADEQSAVDALAA